MKNFTVISSDELYSDEESGITAYEIMIMLQDDSRILRDNIKVYARYDGQIEYDQPELVSSEQEEDDLHFAIATHIFE